MPEPRSQKDINLDVEKLQLEKLKAENDLSLQEKRLDLEIEKLKLDRDKFTFEQAKTDKTERFINKNVGTVITAVVAFAAVLVSSSQVWVAYITKDKELKVAQEQKKQDTAVLQAQRDRENNLSFTKFVFDNYGKIFGGDLQQQERMQNVILALFPSEVTTPFFKKSEQAATNPKSKQLFKRAREASESAYKDTNSQVSTDTNIPAKIDTSVADIVANISFSVYGKRSQNENTLLLSNATLDSLKLDLTDSRGTRSIQPINLRASMTLYRDVYKYKLSASSYKPVEGIIDLSKLQRQANIRLSCILVSTTGDGSSNCDVIL